MQAFPLVPKLELGNQGLSYSYQLGNGDASWWAQPTLREDLPDHLPRHVRQPEPAPVVLVRQPFVVHP